MSPGPPAPRDRSWDGGVHGASLGASRGRRQSSPPLPGSDWVPPEILDKGCRPLERPLLIAILNHRAPCTLSSAMPPPARTLHLSFLPFPRIPCPARARRECRSNLSRHAALRLWYPLGSRLHRGSRFNVTCGCCGTPRVHNGTFMPHFVSFAADLNV